MGSRYNWSTACPGKHSQCFDIQLEMIDIPQGVRARQRNASGVVIDVSLSMHEKNQAYLRGEWLE